MKEALKKLTAVLFLFSFMTILQAKHVPSFDVLEDVGVEGLIKIDLPLPLVEQEIKTLLLSEGSPLKKIETFKLDPINNTLFLAGELNLPTSLLHTLEEQADRKLQKSHSFNIVIGLPSPKLLSASRYVLFRILKFELDGIDYSKGFHIISRVIPAILSNRSLVNYFMDDKKPPTQLDDEDLSAQVKTFLDTKAIKFRDNTIRVRFNLSEFTDLKRFAVLKELRLWHFSPVVLKGTRDYVAFRIEAGLGKPAQQWVNAAKERQSDDKLSLKEARQQLYEEYSFNSQIEEKLKSDISKEIAETEIRNWDQRSLNEFKSLEHLIISQARAHLSVDDILFEADPVEAQEAFMREADDIITLTVLDIKKKQLLDNQNRNGGRHGTTLPFATKRFSQKAVDQFTNFFRDFEFDNEQLFSKLHVVLAPQFPGVVIKGDVNLNINTLLQMGLEGSGIDFSTDSLRFDENTYGKSLPFELSLYVYLRDNSMVELDVRSATIGEGNNKVLLTPKNQNGNFLAEFTKMVTVNVLKTYLISDPLASSDEAQNPDEMRNKLKRKIIAYKDKYQRLAGNQKQQNQEAQRDLLKFTELDLKNPLFDIPANLGEEQLTEFFSGLLGYDDESGRVQINLSPSLFSKKISDADNTLQIWNFEPLFDKTNGKTYFELAVGDRLRTKKYINHLYMRPERADSENFTGTVGQIKDESPVDYSLKLDLSEFKTTINSILTASIEPQMKTIRKGLRAARESSYNVLEDISLKAAGSDLNLKFSLNSISKKKKSFGSRMYGRVFRGDKNEFVVENQRASFQAKVGLTAVPLARYKARILQKNPNEVFLGDSLIRLELKTIGRTVQNSGFVSSLINRMIGNVNLESGLIGKNLKKLILKIAGPYLNAQGSNNGKTNLAGIRINQYAKVFTLDGDIFFQINPRLAGPVWDFYPLKNQNFNNRRVGLFVDQRRNTFNLDFKSAFAPSSVDKIEIYNLIKKAQTLVSDLKENGIEDQGQLLRAYDIAFYNNDRTKKSLYHKLLAIINNYQDLTLSQYEENKDQFSFTSTGAELIHVASASTALKTLLIELREVGQDFPAIQYDQQLEKIIATLENQFIAPCLDIYKKKYHRNNHKILNKDVTDWNFYVYPDTLYAENTFQTLLKLHK